MNDSVFRVFDNIYDILLIIDGDQNVFYGNDAAAQLLETTSRRLSGGKPLSGYFTYTQGLLEPGIDLASVKDATPSRETSFLTSDGKEGWTQVSIQLLPKAMQANSGVLQPLYLVYMRDVTLERILAKKFQDQLDAKEAVIKDLQVARQDLENYSKNLEKMVEARTVELRDANRMIATILDSLGQGIFVFDRFGKCLPFYSKISEKMFGMSPANQAVTDFLKMDVSEKAHFEKWTEAVFSEMLDFQDLAPLGPSKLSNTKDRHIAFDFHPMRGDSGLRGVVLVATDKTDEMKAKKEAERERSFAKRVVQIVQHRQQFRTFANEAFRICQDLIFKFESNEGLDSEEIARHLHTVKGGAASFSLVDIAEVAHHSEDALIKFLRQSGSPTLGVAGKLEQWPAELRHQLKADVEKMVAALKEFIESHSFLTGASSQPSGRSVEIPVATLADWHRRAQDPVMVSKVSREIFENWVQEPAVKSFTHLNSSLVELSERLGKRLAPIEFEGADVKVLPEAYADLFATFIHAFRNAIDHGIETPGERLQKAKPEAGRIALRFERVTDGGKRLLKAEIRDDGRGIDANRIRTRLIEKGLPVDLSASDEQIIQSVFRDDFSTAAQVTDVSGRGVGLSAIKAEAEKMGGSVRVESVAGQGSKLTILVPDLDESFDASATSSQGTAPERIKQAG